MSEVNRARVLWLLLVWMAMCAAPVEAADRQAFARAMDGIARSLRYPEQRSAPNGCPVPCEGMTAKQVLALLGPPDDIERPPDEMARPLTEIRKLRAEGFELPEWPDTVAWCYGVDRPGGFPTLGVVVINSKNRVTKVVSGVREPPPARLVPEHHLRRVLRLLDAPTYDDRFDHDPLAVIRAVNALQELGKDRALAVIAEYVRLHEVRTSQGGHHNECPYHVYPLLRLLFELPAGIEEPDFLFDQYDYWLFSDVPVGFGSGGGPGGVQVNDEILAFYRQHGILRARTLRPPDRPWSILAELESRPGYVGDEADQGLRREVRRQVLRMLRPVFRIPPGDSDPPVPIGQQTDAWWEERMKELERLNIRWDSRKNIYTFPDGSQLPEEPRKRRFPRFL